MQLAMIGLGRMGANMVRRLMGDGHACVVHDAQAENVAALVAEGATGAVSLARGFWISRPRPWPGIRRCQASANR